MWDATSLTHGNLERKCNQTCSKILIAGGNFSYVQYLTELVSDNINFLIFKCCGEYTCMYINMLLKLILAHIRLWNISIFNVK